MKDIKNKIIIMRQQHQNDILKNQKAVWKVSKYGVFPGPNMGKYGPEKTHAL